MYNIIEQKEIFTEKANQIENWHKLSVDDLMNLYIQNEGTIYADYYLSAVICKLWSRMTSYYYKNIKSVTFEDCIDWMTTAIMSALRYRRWLDPNSSMYKDPKGPSKSINVSLKSQEQGFYQYSNKTKRKINYALDSLERIKKELNNEEFLEEEENEVEEQFSIPSVLIQKYAKKEKIFNIFVLSTIIFSKQLPKDDTLSKFILNNLSNIDTHIIYLINNKYSINKEILLKELKYIKTLSRYRLLNKINKSLIQIKEDIIKLQENL